MSIDNITVITLGKILQYISILFREMDEMKNCLNPFILRHMLWQDYLSFDYNSMQRK